MVVTSYDVPEGNAIEDSHIESAILSTSGTGAYLIKITQGGSIRVTLQGNNISNNYRFYTLFSYYHERIKTYLYRSGKWLVETYMTNSDIKYLDIEFLNPVFDDLGGAGKLFIFAAPVSNYPELTGKTLLSASFYHWPSNMRGVISVGFDKYFSEISILSTSQVIPTFIKVRVVYI